jgi:hypothetical protein
MEKPGMARRRRPFGTGLLGFLLFILFPHPSGASGPEEDLLVIAEISPDDPVQNAPWKLSFLVDHPVSGELRVLPPSLPAALSLEQVRTEGRWIRTAENQNARWTLVEFLFIPQRAGLFSLGSFEFIAPHKRALTGELQVYVRSEEGVLREYHPQLLWDPYPGSLRIGERTELTLRLVDWNPAVPLPGKLSFLLDAPEEAVLEDLPLTGTDRGRQVILRLGLIPLKGGLFSLPPLHSHYEAAALTSPALSIRISAPSGTEGPATPPLPEAAEPVPSATETAAIPFPSGGGEVFFLFRDAYGAAAERARVLWDRGSRAEALAGLRRDERDLLAGYTLLPLRRAAEKALGLELTGDEKRRPLKPLAFISLGSGVFLILMGIVYFFPRHGAGSKKRAVTFGQSWGYRGIIIVLLIILSGGLYGLAGGLIDRGFPGRGGPAVLRSCTAYRVPDPQGGVSAYWDEGQPVRVRSGADDWAYVETFDGKAGWVLREEIVFY